MFPVELDITKYVDEAVREGVPPLQIAMAIMAGFKKVNPVKLEQCAEELVDLAYFSLNETTNGNTI